MSIASHGLPEVPSMPARRAFLAGVLGDALSDPNPQFRRIPAERIALLREIALRWEQRLPAGAIPELRAGDACAGHGVCASVCPTGALRRFYEPGLAGLEFDAAECFACGACIVVCPEKALRLEARGAGRPPPKPERITRHALRVCGRCEDEFTGPGEHELCPACRKDIALFTTAFPARSDGT